MRRLLLLLHSLSWLHILQVWWYLLLHGLLLLDLLGSGQGVEICKESLHLVSGI